MSDTTPFGFGRFVPGFDFLQNLAKGAAAGMPALSGWVAPTMSVEEIDRRIQELKTVQFWLEQNARALTATVQALEVQKMTLATLQGMNVAMGDMVGAFGAAHAAGDGGSATRQAAAAPAPAPAPEPAPQPEAPAQEEPRRVEAQPEPAPAGPAAPGMVDPVQWWGALTNQFQQLAANALKDAGAHRAAFESTRDMASGAFKAATDMAAQMAAQGMPGAAAAARPKAKAAADDAQAKPAAKPRPAARKTAAAAKKPAAPR
ncbi:PhaM family polyhydroxyalkanoate granule multifunctional regulatory protein [Alicycliphilus denitrificans]|uniref:Uncharacterized protein n=1 Tax=Alicycliphilus denitrificans TaxID=179636 RepID=A0A420KDK8_9BURK|nr:PhaM family polyhydroxyalkanoate granule multifunctional regulatory protein [Alicycliphilus denitrificans]RKJ97281.1 hypothetical protein CE154_015005 [Alicycliphilus denitrificans]